MTYLDVITSSGAKLLNLYDEFDKLGIDEESLYNIALTYKHPERTKWVFKFIAKYKPHIKDAQNVYNKLFAILESFDKSFSSSPLMEKLTQLIEQDKLKRLVGLEKTKRMIEEIIIFFRPDSRTTSIQKLIFVPTDPVYNINSGRGFSSFPSEYIIISNIDNILNQKHEFIHSIINPIVEKLSESLSEGQKKRISEMASDNLKFDQEYGEDYYSLLCEEFIRVYTEYIAKGERPIRTFNDFIHLISRVDENQFQRLLVNEKELRSACNKFGIKSVDDFKDKIKAINFFEKFLKKKVEGNKLRDIVYEFYQEYLNQKDKEAVNFEMFVLVNFSNRI